jgi:hypothetical protein
VHERYTYTLTRVQFSRGRWSTAVRETDDWTVFFFFFSFFYVHFLFNGFFFFFPILRLCRRFGILRSFSFPSSSPFNGHYFHLVSTVWREQNKTNNNNVSTMEINTTMKLCFIYIRLNDNVKNLTCVYLWISVLDLTNSIFKYNM